MNFIYIGDNDYVNTKYIVKMSKFGNDKTCYYIKIWMHNGDVYTISENMDAYNTLLSLLK